MRALVRGGWLVCAASGLMPAMYVQIPLNAALHFCAVVVQALLLGVCAAHRSLSRPVYALAVGMESGIGSVMGMMLSSSSGSVGTVRQGVGRVRGQDVLREGYCARRGIRVRVLEEEC
jgi:hypothetical protein